MVVVPDAVIVMLLMMGLCLNAVSSTNDKGGAWAQDVQNRVRNNRGHSYSLTYQANEGLKGTLTATDEASAITAVPKSRIHFVHRRCPFFVSFTSMEQVERAARDQNWSGKTSRLYYTRYLPHSIAWSWICYRIESFSLVHITPDS